MIDKLRCETCPDHPHTLERLATMEKGMLGVEGSMKDVVDRLGKMRDTTIEEFRIIRQDIQEGILKRYPLGVVWVISLLTGLVCGLATALFNHL